MIGAIRVISGVSKYMKSGFCGIIPVVETRPVIGKIASLQGDIVELSASAKRWSKPAEEYIPKVIKGAKNSQIPMHHDVNSANSLIDGTLRGLKGNGLTEDETDFLNYTIRKMYRCDKAFKELKPLEHDAIGYRGRVAIGSLHHDADFSIINKARVGDIVIPHEGYSYLGFDKGVFSHYAPYGALAPTIRYTIRIPKGAKVSRNLEHCGVFGGEILMPRGAEYKLISKKKQGNCTDVVLEYILPTKDNVAETEALAKKFNVDLFGKLCL